MAGGLTCEFDGASAVVRDAQGQQLVGGVNFDRGFLDRALGVNHLVGDSIVPVGSSIRAGFVENGFDIGNKGNGRVADVEFPNGKKIQDIPCQSVPKGSLGPK
ncbi:MAG TPA: hypothetical protein PKI93_05950 [Alphaproteobacteria bacterium]|nr:hypothetical protein [Alphaproteobacteria bacterium]HNS43891.1 hypothetical protein [Alphaproteobacteria bacterium]